ncbi:hypothetical protein OAO91_03910 [Luminiphilus sp.]|nr:hypothetical protein [Luminiphilus sp.]
MKQLIASSVWTLLLTMCTGSFALANDHMIDNINVSQPFNVQANLCKLNPGVSLEDYQAMIDDYLEWAEKNEIDPVFVRQLPLFSHQNLARPWPYDFVEFLVSDYQRWGAAWDSWLTSEEGMALNERWQSLAVCHVKQAHASMLYADQKAMAEDDERYVTWNWCTRKEGVTVEELSAKHREYAQDMQTDSGGIIGWLVMLPHAGGADSPGEFAHVAVYPDMESFMTRRSMLANGGWRVTRDYFNLYADCTGEMLNTETVLHRP